MDDPPKFDRKIRIKSYIIPIVTAALIIPQFMEAGRAWEFLLVAFGGAFLLSLSWTFSFYWRLSFRREMKQSWGQVGDHFSEQFTVFNKGPFPALAVTILDHSNFPWYKSNVVWPVVGNLDRKWYMDNILFKRGIYRIGPTEIRATDPFGIFEVTIESQETLEILVIPPIVPLKQINIAAGDWHGEGGPVAKSFERTATAASVREYISGDSYISIHWPTSARRDDIFVRTFDQQPTSDWWILLDLDRSVHAGEGLDCTLEYAMILAASIADRGLRENRAVGLIGESNKPIWLPPKTGSGQRAEILYALALADQGEMSLRTLLSNSQRYFGKKSNLIIITSSEDPSWLEPLNALKKRGITSTVLLLDQAEFDASESDDTIQNLLAGWGIRHFLIEKSIYSQPEMQDFFPRQTRVSPFSSVGRGRKLK